MASSSISNPEQPTTDDVRKRWDAFAEDFANFDPIMRQSWQPMLDRLALSSATAVLEVGCGRGSCALAITKAMPSFCKLIVTDLSPEMVTIAKSVLPVTVGVEVADGSNLHHISDASVDRYIANMCLHIVPDPDAMLCEARRVLMPDGIAAFSIWGDPENSVLMSAKPGNQYHPNFKLGADLTALHKRIQAAGFSKVVMFRQPCILELWDAERATLWWSKIDHKSLPEDERWFQEMNQGYQEALDQGKPISLEAVIIFARP